MSPRAKTLHEGQSRRVAAWIYAVINPMVDSLQRELSLLEVENLTWRSSSGRCEIIKLIQEYVDPRQWPNYSDFLADNSLFLKTFELHDADVQSLNSQAKKIYDWLLSWDQFSTTVAELLHSYENQRASIGPQAPSFSNSRSDLPKVAAENIINNIPTLPSHYLFAPFWNFASKSFLVFRGLPEFQPLHTSRAELTEISSALKAALEDHRLSLSRKFDVPAAPVPGISFEE
jgi:hypothetical protein